MSKQRLAFLDSMRGIAVLWMIQVHITNQILDQSLRHGWWFTTLNISNGFVAPAFLFGAGMGLWIALSRKAEDYLRFGPGLRRYLRRLGYILVWAYMLHVPLEALTSRPVGDLSSWLQFDVLQTIVAGSLLCLAIAIAVQSVTKARIVYSFLALATIVSAPYVMRMQVDTTMPVIVRVLIDRTVSPFPPVPWAFYLVAGAAFAGWIIPRTQHRSLWVWLTAGGALTSAAAVVRYRYGPTLPWDEHWWQGSPDLFLFRLGGIIAVLGLMMRIDRTSTPGPGMSFLHVMGSESLFMYISHLMIVYGATGTWLITTLGLGQSGYGMIFLVWVAVTAPLAALAYGWRWIRKHHPHWAFRITAAHVASMLIWLLWVVLA